jgi:holliday junction DNA helicase RuvA
MIGRLKGILLEKSPPHLLIDVQGVGYVVEAPLLTCYRLPEPGQEVILHTHFVVREDAQLLYGFSELQERSLFRNLIKVSNVGPKLALAILSGLEPDAFVRCIMNNDATALVKIPGVGKKTAERLVIEMRDRLADWQLQLAKPIVDKVLSSADQMTHEAISALVSLGYKPQEAKQAITRIYQKQMSSAELIRLALQSMV